MQPPLRQMQPLPDSPEVCDVQNRVPCGCIYIYIYIYIYIHMFMSWYIDVYNIRFPPPCWHSTPWLWTQQPRPSRWIVCQKHEHDTYRVIWNTMVILCTFWGNTWDIYMDWYQIRLSWSSWLICQMCPHLHGDGLRVARIPWDKYALRYLDIPWDTLRYYMYPTYCYIYIYIYDYISYKFDL